MYTYAVRTIVPLIVGALISWAAVVGLDLPVNETSAIVLVAVTWVYGLAVRWLERRYPQVGALAEYGQTAASAVNALLVRPDSPWRRLPLHPPNT